MSVLVPCWNAATTVERALASVLVEQAVPLECLVIDDGSTDGTADLVRTIADRDPRVVLIPVGANEGVSSARNRGLDAARGAWLTFLDADDRLPPGAIAALLGPTSDPAVRAVVGQRVWTDGEHTWLSPVYDIPDIREPGRKSVASHPGLLYYASATGKLLHRSLVGDRRFEARVLGDQPWTIHALLRAGDGIEVIGETVYEWHRPHPDRYVPTITAETRTSASRAAEMARVARTAFLAVRDDVEALVGDEAARRILTRTYFERLLRSDIGDRLRIAADRRDPATAELYEAVGQLFDAVPASLMAETDVHLTQVVRSAGYRFSALDASARRSYWRMIRPVLRRDPRSSTHLGGNLALGLAFWLARRVPAPVGEAPASAVLFAASLVARTLRRIGLAGAVGPAPARAGATTWAFEPIERDDRVDHRDLCYRPADASPRLVRTGWYRPRRPGGRGRAAGAWQPAVRLRRVATIVRLLARDLGIVATGPRAVDHPMSVARAIRDLRSYVLALWSQLRGRRSVAADRSERLLEAYPDLAWSLRIVSSSRSRRGELSASLDATRRLRRIADSAELRRRERDLVGRLRETEPGWLPTIVGVAGAVEPSGANIVMHLFKASLPDRQSGYTIRSRETLRAQVEAGLEPFAVTPFGYPPARPGAPTPTMEVVDGIRHVRLEPGAETDGIPPDELLARTATLAAEVARRERPAIIQATSGHRGYEYALVGAALRAHLHRPLVYEVRGFLEASWTADPSIAESAEGAELTRRRLATEMRAMTSADGITTIASAMRDELVERGIPAEKIVVVPNGVDPTAFQPLEPDPDLRARYGLGDRWVFGYVSNMDHFREGHEVLIEATARLVGAGRPVACLLVGDGLLRSRLEARVAAAGLKGSVIFTGKVPYDRVRAHYALLDAFVVARVPDRAARFVTPLKPYEAMAMGLPLVVSDLPALTEIAAPDERGLAFPNGDATALAATLGRLIDQPRLRADLAAAGRAWVLKERTWAANGARYRDLYEAILERFDAGA